MKARHFLILLASLALHLAPLNAGEIKMEFENVDDYTDFSISGMTENKTLPLFISEMEENLKGVAKRYLEEGQTLELVFTDIDMAGDIQPWRNRHNADIRYVEAIYPPRLKFRYALKDAEGEVLAEGEESISDLSFQMSTTAALRSSFEQFRYEFELLENWIRRSFKKRG